MDDTSILQLEGNDCHVVIKAGEWARMIEFIAEIGWRPCVPASVEGDDEFAVGEDHAKRLAQIGQIVIAERLRGPTGAYPTINFNMGKFAEVVFFAAEGGFTIRNYTRLWDLHQYEPSDWIGRRIIEQDNMGDWGGWLQEFEDGIFDALVESDGSDSSVAEELALSYMNECDGRGLPVAEYFDTGDWRTDNEAAFDQVKQEFIAYLGAWRSAIAEGRTWLHPKGGLPWPRSKVR